VSQLKTGQRLVSLEGDVWRWDGFVASAHAPTGAARRLAERARLVDIEHELEQARADAAAKRQALEDAEAELKAASAAESPPARPGARAAQADAARSAMPRPSARSIATPRANPR
jgi:chromosome segregation protein